MKCQSCGKPVILTDSKFCPHCGTKVEPLPQTPPLHKTFSGISQIKCTVGNNFTIKPSPTDEVMITIEGDETVKQAITFDVDENVLLVYQEQDDEDLSFGNFSINIGGCSGISISSSRSISINTSVRREVILVEILVPPGTGVSIDTSGEVRCAVIDVDIPLSIDTSGGCIVTAESLSKLKVDISGNFMGKVSRLVGRKCQIDTSGNCSLEIPTGEIEKLDIDSSGNTTLSVLAHVQRARLDVSGSISGTLRADSVKKDISGRSNLYVLS